MEIIGAVLIGLSLGLFGSGGSILTVPVLLYLVGMPAQLAIASSLFIVGAISALASIRNTFVGNVSWRHVAYFGIPGMLGTYLGAWLGVLVGELVQLTVFALLMIVAAFFMWRRRSVTDLSTVTWRPWKVIAEGTAVGVITGLVGVGGGFLIVPALVILGGLSLATAVATSLVVIALKSFAGFAKYYTALTATGMQFDWSVIALLIVAGFIGSVAGGWLGRRLPTTPLQRGFAVFLVAMGVFVLWRSLSL